MVIINEIKNIILNLNYNYLKMIYIKPICQIFIKKQLKKYIIKIVKHINNNKIFFYQANLFKIKINKYHFKLMFLLCSLN